MPDKGYFTPEEQAELVGHRVWMVKSVLASVPIGTIGMVVGVEASSIHIEWGITRKPLSLSPDQFTEWCRDDDNHDAITNIFYRPKGA